MGNDGRTQISELGKYGLINRITGNIQLHNESTVAGAGDDAAIISTGNPESYLLVTTDLILEGIHFNLVYTPLKHLGYKSVVRAISDIYAMNGKPQQVLIALGIGARFYVEDIDDFYEGAKLACNRYGTDLAGGDTASSLTGLTISVTATGTVQKKDLTRRSGACSNDLICVTGNLGAAYMGLQLLERERKLFKDDSSVQPDLSGYEYIIGRQLKPEVPCDIIDELKEKNIFPTSMTDISEGLASDLLQICRKSDKGCRIFTDKIPIDTETARMAEEFRLDPLIPALNGGEDFELLFTVPLELYDKITTMKNVSVIGHIMQPEYGCFVVTEEGEELSIEAQGWKK